jgi:D-alanyl-D-alanine carboxypeptidase
VSALAGYVTTAAGEELAFSIIVNGANSIDDARLVQDSIGVRLSLFDRTRVAPAESSRAGPPPPRSRP